MIININQHYFHIIENHKDAFNQEMFEGRYSEILDRYPYIVGDIGFEQLRLKGFFDDNKKGADISKRFSSIQDYLLEYCNFGCPYFVLKRLTDSEVTKLIQPEAIETIVDESSASTQNAPETELVDDFNETEHHNEQSHDNKEALQADEIEHNNKTLKGFLG